MTNIDNRRNGTLKNWFIISAGADTIIRGELDGRMVRSKPLLRVDFTQGFAVTRDATYMLEPKKVERIDLK